MSTALLPVVKKEELNTNLVLRVNHARPYAASNDAGNVSRPGRKRKNKEGQSSDEGSGGSGGNSAGTHANSKSSHAKQNGGTAEGVNHASSQGGTHHHRHHHKDRELGKINVVDKPDKNSVHIRFDHSTKKLWQVWTLPQLFSVSFLGGQNH